MSKSFPEWWKHGQNVRTANDGVLTLNIAEDSEYWLTNNAGKEVPVFSMDILGPASVSEACSMTTDITELAPAMKAAAKKATPGPWALARDGKTVVSNQSHPIANVTDVMHRMLADGTTGQDAEFISLANPANILALVEALEKAQTINAAAEKLVRCKGRYHSEQNYRALAALFGVKTPDLPPLDSESRTVTVKLVDINEFLADVHDKTLALAFRRLAEGVREADIAALTAQGIKWEAE